MKEMAVEGVEKVTSEYSLLSPLLVMLYLNTNLHLLFSYLTLFDLYFPG